MNTAVRKAALDGLYLTGASRLLQPIAGGVGAVLMLHRVRPAREDPFQPNRSLEVTPAFLEETLQGLKGHGYEFVTLDEVRCRLANRDFDSRFASVTLDDGYRDNAVWAKPVFEKLGVPYTIYVPTDYADGTGDLWWLTLEEVVARNDRVVAGDSVIPAGTLEEKFAAYAELLQMVMGCDSRADEIALVDRIARQHGHDARAAVREECMRWDELRELASTPLATIGAHTRSHLALAKATECEARSELVEARQILQDRLDDEVRHLAYPYGSEASVGERDFRIAAEAGYATAVTTELGVLKAEDNHRLTALPRINIDGRYQRQRYVDVLVSGVGPAIWRRVRHLARRTALAATGVASAPLTDLPL